MINEIFIVFYNLGGLGQDCRIIPVSVYCYLQHLYLIFIVYHQNMQNPSAVLPIKVPIPSLSSATTSQCGLSTGPTSLARSMSACPGPPTSFGPSNTKSPTTRSAKWQSIFSSASDHGCDPIESPIISSIMSRDTISSAHSASSSSCAASTPRRSPPTSASKTCWLKPSTAPSRSSSKWKNNTIYKPNIASTSRCKRSGICTYSRSSASINRSTIRKRIGSWSCRRVPPRIDEPYRLVLYIDLFEGLKLLRS